MIITLTLLVFSTCTTPTAIDEKATATLPNIILLIADDQGYPYFGFMGTDYAHTPNMDSLA